MTHDNRNTKENIQSQKKQQQQGQQQPSISQWSQMIGQVVESITGKNMSTTINLRI